MLLYSECQTPYICLKTELYYQDCVCDKLLPMYKGPSKISKTYQIMNSGKFNLENDYLFMQNILNLYSSQCIMSSFMGKYYIIFQ